MTKLNKQLIFYIISRTVKPVYNSHPWDLKKVVVMQRVFLKRSVVRKASDWPLLTGGHCSEVVVRSGLTVLTTWVTWRKTFLYQLVFF
jgi:hypothetical protein